MVSRRNEREVGAELLRATPPAEDSVRNEGRSRPAATAACVGRRRLEGRRPARAPSSRAAPRRQRGACAHDFRFALRGRLQKLTFRPSWMLRAGAVSEMVPNCARQGLQSPAAFRRPQFVSGFLKFARLKALKKSALSWTRTS